MNGTHSQLLASVETRLSSWCVEEMTGGGQKICTQGNFPLIICD